jgi:hypothetical protein
MSRGLLNDYYLINSANEESANISAATPTMFLVFYRFKAMSDQEAQKSSAEWNDLKKSLPFDVRLSGEYNHAWALNTMDSCYLRQTILIRF